MDENFNENITEVNETTETLPQVMPNYYVEEEASSGNPILWILGGLLGIAALIGGGIGIYHLGKKRGQKDAEFIKFGTMGKKKKVEKKEAKVEKEEESDE